MAAKPISCSNQAALEQVMKVRDEIAKSVVSQHDMLPHLESGDINAKNAESQYEKFGLGLVRLAQHWIKSQKARNACINAADSLAQSGTIQFPLAARNIAITKFGRGECGELVALAWPRLAHLYPHAIYMTSTPDGLPRHGSILRDHGFILLGVSKEEADKTYNDKTTLQKIVKLMKREGIWIFDPLFHILCPGKKYETEARDLKQYLETFKIHHLLEVRTFTSEQQVANVPSLFQEAELIYEMVQKLYADTSPPEETQEIWNLITPKLKNELLPKVTQILNTHFSPIAWKEKVDSKDANWTVWTQGDPKTLEAVGDSLKALGASVSANRVKQKKDKAAEEPSYAILLKDPDPTQLQALFDNHLTPRIDALMGLSFPRGVSTLIAQYNL